MKITVQPPNCIWCGKENKPIALDRKKFDEWQRGGLIQNVFPELDVDTREILINGTHPACWDEMMKGEDE